VIGDRPPIANAVSHVNHMIGPIEALEGPDGRSPVIAGFGVICAEAYSILHDIDYPARIGPGPLQQEPSTPCDKLTRRPEINDCFATIKN
jgi:hypothetical protein